jgi:hypothetical protein
VASLQMANRIGLDAGLMSGAACPRVGQCLALPAMIAIQRSIDIGFTHPYGPHTAHRLLGTYVWWF